MSVCMRRRKHEPYGAAVIKVLTDFLDGKKIAKYEAAKMWPGELTAVVKYALNSHASLRTIIS